MVRGLGIDLVTISRIERLIERYGSRFTDRLFTEREQSYCRRYARPGPYFAVRFAAKEAMLKALGVPSGLRWHELEVVRDRGAPEVELHGGAERAAAALGIERMLVTLTHEGDTAAAVVVAEG